MSRLRSTLACSLAAILLFAQNPLASAQASKKKEPPRMDGHLSVEDGGGMFSPEAIRKAKSVLSEVRDSQRREMTIVTFKEIPESKKKVFEGLAADRNKFFMDWAKEETKGSRGVFVFICRSPGHVRVLVDKQVRDQGFTDSDEQRLRDMFLEPFRESAKAETDKDKQALRDKGLERATEYVRDAYKKMVKVK